jgi:16S rRNA (guanine527-N7)-methyltransferase
LKAEPDAGDPRSPLRASLGSAAQALDLPMTPQQASRLLDFVELLMHWNRTYNLTAIRGLQHMLTHHVVDCLAAVAPLRRELEGRSSPRILDVGSGGGLPGVVFAVMDPTLRVTCVDSVGKKAAFVQQASTSLGLDNLVARHARVESLAEGCYDVIACRAFASLVDFTDLSARLLKSEGCWLALKGKVPTAEISALPSSIEVFHVERLVVPGVEGERCLVWMRPDADRKS